MHRPVQPKSLSWWGEVGNSLIFQHSPLRGGSFRPQTWNRSEQQLFYLIALTRIRTRDLWLWYHIELHLHAPTSLTQKLKLIRRGGQFTYIPTGTKLKVPSHLLPYKHNVLWIINEFEDLNKQEKQWLSWVQNKRTQSRGPTWSFGKLGCKPCHCACSCNLYPIWATYMCCLPHRKKKLSENLLSADLHGALLIGDPYAGLLY